MAVALLSSGVRHRMLEVVLTMVKYGAQGILQPMTFEFGQPRVVHPASASGVVYGRKKHRRGDHLEYNGARAAH